MSRMLLSINPIHVENILRGVKHFEFRRVRCKKPVTKIVVYSTAPEKKVVAEADVLDIIEDDILKVWHQTKEHAGIDYRFFRSYYKGRKKAVAYKLGNVEIHEEPKELADYGVNHPPQSFVYV